MGKVTLAGIIGIRRWIADLVLGSWVRTVIAAVLLIAVFAGGVLAATGRIHLPGLLGQPAPARVSNPFNPGQMIDAAEAARVKADLLQDGQIELHAFEQGDPSLLPGGVAGRELISLQQAISRNTSNGVRERWSNQLTSIVVGQLPDPNDSTVIWCVEERGQSKVDWISISTGAVQRTDQLSADDKFWLAKSGNRYLIADVEVSAQPLAG